MNKLLLSIMSLAIMAVLATPAMAAIRQKLININIISKSVLPKALNLVSLLELKAKI